jgi:Raf kinase inhibitor-like YbhB/YbcL family protein
VTELKRRPLPHDFHPPVPSFTVTSEDVEPGATLKDAQVYAAGNTSPQLRWEGFPPETKSFAVTCYDPDAPTGSGFWHWVAWDIPAGVNSLPTGAVLPAGAVNGENDGGTLGYQGPCPPVGDRTHHYHITVVALDVPSLGLPATTHAAVVGFNVGAHALAAAEFVATAQR